MRRVLAVIPIAILIVGCSAPANEASSAPASVIVSTEPSAAATPEPTSPSTPTAEPAASLAPRALFGTWRTTLAGQPLSLNITETTYRIVRGPNAANGSVSVTGDQIEFFDSDLCAGTSLWRWEISDAGELTLFPLANDPCPGRAEALIVRYPDYSPPSGG